MSRLELLRSMLFHIDEWEACSPYKLIRIQHKSGWYTFHFVIFFKEDEELNIGALPWLFGFWWAGALLKLRIK